MKRAISLALLILLASCVPALQGPATATLATPEQMRLEPARGGVFLVASAPITDATVIMRGELSAIDERFCAFRDPVTVVCDLSAADSAEIAIRVEGRLAFMGAMGYVDSEPYCTFLPRPSSPAGTPCSELEFRTPNADTAGMQG